MTAKIAVKLPQGWDNHLILDAKDHAALVEILHRSQCATERYCAKFGDNALVEAAPFNMSSKTAFHLMTDERFKQLEAEHSAEKDVETEHEAAVAEKVA